MLSESLDSLFIGPHRCNDEGKYNRASWTLVLESINVSYPFS